MNNNILGYISTVNAAVWAIPIIIAVWMLIKKKFKFKDFIIGILTYITVYIIQQILLIGFSMPLGGLMSNSVAVAVAVYAVAIPPVAVFGTSFIYKKVTEDKSWYGTVGYGLGLGYATVIAELGMKLLSNLFMAVMLTDGNVSGLSAEQLEAYKEAENMLKAQTGNFYISVGIAAVMIFTVSVVNVLLARKSDETGRKFPLVFSYIFYTVMYALFTVSVYVGKTSFVVMLLMMAVIAFAVYYLTKSYDAQNIETEYVSAPSPLLGKNPERRYKTKKKRK